MSKTFQVKIPISGRVRECLGFVRNQKIKGKVVVDIGSSFGWLENELKNERAILIGVEPNSEAVVFSNKNFRDSAKFIVGDALNVPIKSNSVDIVIFFDVIEHVPRGSELKALKEINRILKKDGILLLTTPNSHWLANLLDPAWYLGHRHYSRSRIEKLIKKSEFTIIEHNIKGGYLSILHMIWFYFSKWILGKVISKNSFVAKLDDQSYSSTGGFVTHYIKAKKS